MSHDFMPDRTTIVIVTVTFNAEPVVKDFLQSLLAQTHEEWRLIIVDNASTDLTLPILEGVSADPRVEIVACTINTGAAEGNNIGLERAIALGAPYVLMTNNDVVFGPTVLEELLAAKRRAGSGVVSATLFYEGPSKEVWYDGGQITTGIAVRCVHGMPGAVARLDRAVVYETSYAPTTFLLFDTQAILDTGRLDEQFFAYWEDTDLLWRLSKAGYGIWVARDVHVVHKIGQASGGSGSTYSNKQYYKNQMLFTRKHFSTAKVMATALVSLMRIGGRLVLRKDRFGLVRAKLIGLGQGLARANKPRTRMEGWGSPEDPIEFRAVSSEREVRCP